jgi:predicted nuclease with RNAse H fold
MEILYGIESYLQEKDRQRFVRYEETNEKYVTRVYAASCHLYYRVEQKVNESDALEYSGIFKPIRYDSPIFEAASVF